MFQTVVVAYDGSAHSEAAIKAACDLSGRYGAALHVVHVPEIHDMALALGGSAVMIPVSDEAVQQAGEAAAERARQLVQDAGMEPASVSILRGPPAEAILEYASDRKADLIVAGRRGLGRLGGLFLGSVTQKIMAHADCAVLTVK